MMKLGEALNLRADLQTKLSLIGKRLKDNALVQEGDQPAENFDELLRELDQLSEQLYRLIAVINKTNSTTRLVSGESLTEALARREMLGRKHGLIRQAIDTGHFDFPRYSRSEVKFVRQFDAKAINRVADGVARERRELDSQIQEHNWTTEVTENIKESC